MYIVNAWFLYQFYITFQVLSSYIKISEIWRSWFLTLARYNISNTIVTWPPSILKSGPTRIFDPLHIVFGLKLPNLRLPKVLDCLRKFPGTTCQIPLSRDPLPLWKVTQLGFLILCAWSLVWNFRILGYPRC